jgi:hypothetical protein
VSRQHRDSQNEIKLLFHICLKRVVFEPFTTLWIYSPFENPVNPPILLLGWLIKVTCVLRPVNNIWFVAKIACPAGKAGSACGALAIERFMKSSCVIIFTLLLVGCAGTRQSASLTAEQAKTVAMRLANERAFTFYHCKPFRDDQPARLVAGHWVWTDRQGYGHGDIQATVEIAADGSTNNVDLQLFYTMPL